MKNFKLLLGATALLSAGALMANADLGALGYEDSAEFNAQVQLIKAAGIMMINDTVDFGRLVQTGADAPTGTATMDKSGNVTLSGSGAVRDTAAGTQRGDFQINIPEGYTATVTPDESVYLMNENGDELLFTPTVTNTGTTPYPNYIMHHYKVHGSLDLDGVTFYGIYSSIFTVSVIVQQQ